MLKVSYPDPIVEAYTEDSESAVELTWGFLLGLRGRGKRISLAALRYTNFGNQMDPADDETFVATSKLQWGNHIGTESRV